MSKIFLPQLIGEHKVLSLELRTKDSADHAGLSQLLVLSKVTTKSKLDNLYPSQSNNLLIAQLLTMVAVADG